MNEISFTGIQNIKLYRKHYKQFGAYLSPTHALEDGNLQNTVKHGEKYYSEVILHCDIYDDASGADFSNFKETLKKCNESFRINCPDPQNPHHIKIHLKRFDVKDELGHVQNSCFKLNDYDITLVERSTLPLYTFMAYITRQSMKANNISQTMRKYIKFVNKSIANAACEFIENM